MDDRYVDWLFLLIITTIFLLGTLRRGGGVAAARHRDPETLRVARVRRLLAGAVTGAACGMLLTGLFVVAVVIMVIGPVLGAMGGSLGGLLAADHPLRPRLARNWATGCSPVSEESRVWRIPARPPRCLPAPPIGLPAVSVLTDLWAARLVRTGRSPGGCARRDPGP